MADYAYPEEKTALHELIQKREFQAALKIFERTYSDATDFARLQGRNFRVTKTTEPRLYYLCGIAAKRLNYSGEFPIYMDLSYQVLPRIYGTDDKCAVVLSSTCLEELTNLELTAMLGSVISHIQYGHVKYLNMGNVAEELFLNIPFVGGAASMTVKALLLQWREYAEFTADRGAAIAAGDAQGVFGYLSKAMGASKALHNWQKGNGTKSVKTMSKAELLVFQLLAEELPVPFGIRRLETLQEWLHANPHCLKR